MCAFRHQLPVWVVFCGAPPCGEDHSGWRADFLISPFVQTIIANSQDTHLRCLWYRTHMHYAQDSRCQKLDPPENISRCSLLDHLSSLYSVRTPSAALWSRWRSLLDAGHAGRRLGLAGAPRTIPVRGVASIPARGVAAVPARLNAVPARSELLRATLRWKRRGRLHKVAPVRIHVQLRLTIIARRRGRRRCRRRGSRCAGYLCRGKRIQSGTRGRWHGRCQRAC